MRIYKWFDATPGVTGWNTVLTIANGMKYAIIELQVDNTTGITTSVKFRQITTDGKVLWSTSTTISANDSARLVDGELICFPGDKIDLYFSTAPLSPFRVQGKYAQDTAKD